MMKFMEDAPAKKNTMPLAAKAKVSQKSSNAPLSWSRAEMSNLLVAEPYRPKTATAITPAAQQCTENLARAMLQICGNLHAPPSRQVHDGPCIDTCMRRCVLRCVELLGTGHY